MAVNVTLQKAREPVDLKAIDADVLEQIALAVQGSDGATPIKASDSPSVDAFGRWRVANPQNVFDAQLTYDLQPIVYEQITSGSGAAIAHDATNRAALLTFADTPADGQAIMQSYEFMRYQPGKSQAIDITFNFTEGVDGVVKFAGYSSGANGVEFALVGNLPFVRILSDTDEGDEAVAQPFWNLDALDGNGPSGIILDVTKTQIFVIDLQALYVGRVRVGFNIDGATIYCHQFLHANRATVAYIQTANLPIRCGMLATDTVSTTMRFYCASVVSKGGQDDTAGFLFTQTVARTAGNNTRTHAMSIRPKATFNSITNRMRFVLESIEVTVRGSAAVRWELCIGQAISGTTTFNDVNATYSATEYNTAGALSGNPAIVLLQGTAPSSNQSKNTVKFNVASRYPITLNAAGVARALGTLTAVVSGVGATSDVDVTLSWKEVR